MSEIKVSGLRHVYSADTPFEKVAIDNINVEIPHGQLVGLIGHTGSGKSTFIQHLNGLLKPSSGTVTVEAAIPCPTQADTWPAAQRERYRRLVKDCDFETMVSDRYTSTCMQRRDRYMVDHASLLIAAFDGSAGGTRYTVQYAMGQGLDIVDLPIPTA